MNIRHQLREVVVGIVGHAEDFSVDDIVDAIIDSGLLSQAAVRFQDHVPVDPHAGIATSDDKRIVLEPGEHGTYLSIWEPSRVSYPARSLWANLSPRAADELIDALSQRRKTWGAPRPAAQPADWSAYREEARQGVLGRLRTFGRVEWVGYGAETAFADSILELMGYLNHKQRVMLGLAPAEEAPYNPEWKP